MFKPMLATKVKEPIYPYYLSPKLDGIRCVIINGVVLSRSLTPIPNIYIQSRYGRPEYNGLDGELIVGSPTDKDCFRNTSTVVMSFYKEGDIKLYAFDDFTKPLNPFSERFKDLNE